MELLRGRKQGSNVEAKVEQNTKIPLSEKMGGGRGEVSSEEV